MLSVSSLLPHPTHPPRGTPPHLLLMLASVPRALLALLRPSSPRPRWSQLALWVPVSVPGPRILLLPRRIRGSPHFFPPSLFLCLVALISDGGSLIFGRLSPAQSLQSRYLKQTPSLAARSFGTESTATTFPGRLLREDPKPGELLLAPMENCFSIRLLTYLRGWLW